MKHSISINGENIPVELFVLVFDRETNEVVDEGFDTIHVHGQSNIYYPVKIK